MDLQTKNNIKNNMDHLKISKEIYKIEVSSDESQDSTASTCTIDQQNFKLYPQRFLMLAVFSLGTAINGYSISQCAIISDRIITLYGVSHMAANWTTMVSMVGFVAGSIPGIWIFESKGLRIGFLTGMAGTLVGYWIECGSIHPDRFWLLMLGQTVIAVFQTCFFNASPIVAYAWFGEKEVSKASSIAVMFNQIGGALGTIIPPLVVNGKEVEEIRYQMMVLYLSQATVFSAITILAFMVFKGKPATPPSASQLNLQTLSGENKRSFTKDFLATIKNKTYLLHSIPYGIASALCTTIITVLNQMLKQIYPVSFEYHVGYIGLLTQISGCTGMVVIGIILDRFRNYKQMALTVFFGMTVSIAIYQLIIDTNIIAVYATLAVFGFCAYAYSSFGMEIAIQITHPLSEITASTIFFALGSIITLTTINGMTFVVNTNNPNLTIQIFVVMGALGLFITGFL